MGLNHDPGGGGLLDWLFCNWLLHLLSWLGVWNDLSCLINRYHVLRVKVINPVYNGLERSVFFRSILNGLERTLFMHILRLYGLRGARFRFAFDTFGGWSWKDTFTWFLFSMEVTRMVLKGVHWWFRFAPLPSPWGFAIYPSVNGLERSFLVLFSAIFSIARTDFEIFLHKTHMRPNLMLAGWPIMIGFGHLGLCNVKWMVLKWLFWVMLEFQFDTAMIYQLPIVITF